MRAFYTLTIPYGKAPDDDEVAEGMIEAGQEGIVMRWEPAESSNLTLRHFA